MATNMVLILIGVILIFTIVTMFMMRRIGKDVTEIGESMEKVGKSMERIEHRVHAIGKLFSALTIGLIKSSKEQRPLTGKDLAEGLKMVEESKNVEEILEKLSVEQLPEGEKEEVKGEKSKEDTG